MKRKSRALLALSSAAAVLPGISPVSRADSQPEKITQGYTYSEYREDHQPRSLLIGTDSDRYEIDIHQFYISAPVGTDYSITFDAQHEVMSGASPWFVASDVDNVDKVILSGASIKDTRDDYALNIKRYRDNGSVGITAAYSTEDDYRSKSIGADLSVNLRGDMTVLSVSASYADDRINPTEGSVPVPAGTEKKQTTSYFLGISQILNRQSILSFGVGGEKQSGYLTDPYKFDDLRPDTREKYTVHLGYRFYIVDWDAALHGDYRFYHDSWNLTSHTMDVSYYQNLAEHWQLIPGIRYYTQSEAEFFANNHAVDASFYADDYRLSAFGAVSVSLKLVFKYNALKTYFRVERYEGDASKGFGGGDESPGVIDFTLLSVGYDYSF